MKTTAVPEQESFVVVLFFEKIIVSVFKKTYTTVFLIFPNRRGDAVVSILVDGFVIYVNLSRLIFKKKSIYNTIDGFYEYSLYTRLFFSFSKRYYVKYVNVRSKPLY